jgi:hypothetical protein
VKRTFLLFDENFIGKGLQMAKRKTQTWATAPNAGRPAPAYDDAQIPVITRFEYTVFFFTNPYCLSPLPLLY